MNLTGDRNQCQGCKAYFNSSFAFEKHRRGEHGVDRHCLSVEQMRSKGMSKNAAGFWISAAMPESALPAEQHEQDDTCHSCIGTGIGDPRDERSSCWVCGGSGNNKKSGRQEP